MNCEEISELLPAYVMGALEPDEVEAIEVHLREGHEHDAELVELRATLFALDRFSDDLMPVEPVAVVAPPPVVSMRPAPKSASPFFLRPVWRAVAVAAVVVLLFGAGWAVGQVTGGEGHETYAYALQGGNGAFMEVAGMESGDTVNVTMAGLDRLEGNSYQVWAIRDGVWTSIGVCNTNAQGTWVGDFDYSMQGGEGVALTIEPRGGSASPTSEAILRTAY
jgi:anti-sigma-K factor RskA